MENGDYLKVPVGFVKEKFSELVLKESVAEENNGFESSPIQQTEDCEKNETVREIINEKHYTEFATERRNKESSNEQKDVPKEKGEKSNAGYGKNKEIDIVNDEECEKNVGKEKLKFGFEKDGKVSKNGKEDISHEVKFVEVTNNGDSSLTNEKAVLKDTCEVVDVHLSAEIEDKMPNCKMNDTDSEKMEVFKENPIRDDSHLKQEVLYHADEKELIGLKRVEYEKKYSLCTACGSDSKISTSSTEKASSSYSGSKIGVCIEDSTSKDTFKVPTDALVAKIVRQAEFYFSDFNILKNNFLLKHVRRNKEGYVSLKLVASFRKIKSMTKDWRVVAYSLEFSKLLEINSERSKIRRIKPIPQIEETSLGKTVIVFNLPFQNPTSRDLIETFSKFGNIAEAEIMSPKSENYNTYHKRCRFHNPEIESAVFGSVEFQNFDDALSAIKDEESYLPKENKMKVVALMPQLERTRRRNRMFNQYSQHPRRGNGRFKSRYEYQGDQRVNGMNYEEYRYARSVLSEKPFKRYYRGGFTKDVHQTCSGNEIPENYETSRKEERSSSYARSRQLKLSNRMNINGQFMTHPIRYADVNFGYRET